MRTKCRLKTESVEETKELAKRLSQLLQPGDVLALIGDLGAGKTTFAQGIGEGLLIDEPIDSPTFTIVKEYQGRMPFYHMDVYRLETAIDEELGWDEYFYGDGVTLVEWAQRIEPLLPEDTIWIRIQIQEGDQREIHLMSSSERVNPICKELVEV